MLNAGEKMLKHKILRCEGKFQTFNYTMRLRPLNPDSLGMCTYLVTQFQQIEKMQKNH